VTSVRSRHIDLEGRSVPATVIGMIGWRSALFALLCLPFAAVGVALLLLSPDIGERVMGAFTLLFFGGGGLVLLATSVRPGFVALTREGIAAQTRFARSFAPWEAIVGIGRAHIGPTEMITVDVDDPSSIRTSRGIGWLTSINARAGYPDLAFPTNLLGKGSEVLETGVRVYATNPERRARIGSPAEHEALVAESRGGTAR
jgi:hypothetical protein